jgi:ketosteroid isomerase-like protein
MATRNRSTRCYQGTARQRFTVREVPQCAAQTALRHATNRTPPHSHPEAKNLEVLQREARGDLAFWTGFQHATVHFAGRDQPVPMRIRVTDVFRRKNGEWKLIHRHADVQSS